MIRLLRKLRLYYPSIRLLDHCRGVLVWPENRRYRMRLPGASLPLPSPILIYRATGTFQLRWFVESGKIHSDCILETLRKDGLELGGFANILDFGCGCGRILRNWEQLNGPEIHATDHDPKAVRWCRENLPFVRVSSNALTPPLNMEDGSFDFVYSFSVFTHLSESHQELWLRELRRILKPSGYLLITTHGSFYRSYLTSEEQRRFDNGEVIVRNADRSGTNHCSTYHPESHIRRSWTSHFKLVDLIPEGARHQDFILLQKH